MGFLVTQVHFTIDFESGPKTDVKAAHFTLGKKLASKQKHSLNSKIRKYYKVDFLKIKSFMNSKVISPPEKSNISEKENKIKGNKYRLFLVDIHQKESKAKKLHYE